MTEMVNINGEPEVNGGRCRMEKTRSNPHTVTIPPSKTCTTGARSKPLRVSVIEDDATTGVLRERTISDDMSQVVAKGAEAVWTIAGNVAKAAAKRTVVLITMVLGVAGGTLTAVGTLVLWAVDTKMPRCMTVKTMSLGRH